MSLSASRIEGAAVEIDLAQAEEEYNAGAGAGAGTSSSGTNVKTILMPRRRKSPEVDGDDDYWEQRGNTNSRAGSNWQQPWKRSRQHQHSSGKRHVQWQLPGVGIQNSGMRGAAGPMAASPPPCRGNAPRRILKSRVQHAVAAAEASVSAAALYPKTVAATAPVVELPPASKIPFEPGTSTAGEEAQVGRQMFAPGSAFSGAMAAEAVGSSHGATGADLLAQSLVSKEAFEACSRHQASTEAAGHSRSQLAPLMTSPLRQRSDHTSHSHAHSQSQSQAGLHEHELRLSPSRVGEEASRFTATDASAGLGRRQGRALQRSRLQSRRGGSQRSPRFRSPRQHRDAKVPYQSVSERQRPQVAARRRKERSRRHVAHLVKEGRIAAEAVTTLRRKLRQGVSVGLHGSNLADVFSRLRHHAWSSHGGVDSGQDEHGDGSIGRGEVARAARRLCFIDDDEVEALLLLCAADASSGRVRLDDFFEFVGWDVHVGVNLKKLRRSAKSSGSVAGQGWLPAGALDVAPPTPQERLPSSRPLPRPQPHPLEQTRYSAILRRSGMASKRKGRSRSCLPDEEDDDEAVSSLRRELLSRAETEAELRTLNLELRTKLEHYHAANVTNVERATESLESMQRILAAAETAQVALQSRVESLEGEGGELEALRGQVKDATLTAVKWQSKAERAAATAEEAEALAARPWLANPPQSLQQLEYEAEASRAAAAREDAEEVLAARKAQLAAALEKERIGAALALAQAKAEIRQSAATQAFAAADLDEDGSAEFSQHLAGSAAAAPLAGFGSAGAATSATLNATAASQRTRLKLHEGFERDVADLRILLARLRQEEEDGECRACEWKARRLRLFHCLRRWKVWRRCGVGLVWSPADCSLSCVVSCSVVIWFVLSCIV